MVPGDKFISNNNARSQLQRFELANSDLIVRSCLPTGHMFLQPGTASWWCVLLLFTLAASTANGFPQLLIEPSSAHFMPSAARLVKPVAAAAVPHAIANVQHASSSGLQLVAPPAVSGSSPGVQHIILRHKPYASSPATAVNFTIYPVAAAPAAAQAASPLDRTPRLKSTGGSRPMLRRRQPPAQQHARQSRQGHVGTHPRALLPAKP
ncbi:hypothetical protein COO60DRAFT_29198 [Scenedesmus sp. NREL 46B-D3]|nr:hypothetical protein COO60DRAFT_29198 [Scenedesmus sp. NREL 46B-D3]